MPLCRHGEGEDGAGSLEDCGFAQRPADRAHRWAHRAHCPLTAAATHRRLLQLLVCSAAARGALARLCILLVLLALRLLLLLLALLLLLLLLLLLALLLLLLPCLGRSQLLLKFLRQLSWSSSSLQEAMRGACWGVPKAHACTALQSDTRVCLDMLARTHARLPGRERAHAEVRARSAPVQGPVAPPPLAHSQRPRNEGER